MNTVYQLKEKIEELCEDLNLHSSIWNPNGGFSHMRYFGIFYGERPRFLKDTLFCVGYDGRGYTHRSEAFSKLKNVIKILESLNSKTYFFNALTQPTEFNNWPENMNLGKTKK